MVIYFGKLNLNSSHIYQVYKKKLELHDVLSSILIGLKDGIVYEKEEVFKDGLETKISTTKYTLTIRKKFDDEIEGYIYKDALIYYKQVNEITKEFEWKHVVSNEAIEFYLDVYNEIVGYVTATRFGYREFLEAFQGVLNKGLSESKYGYTFSVDLLTSGMKMEDIKEELKAIGNIQRLKFKIQPPNIMDEMLDAIEEDQEKIINALEEGNISSKSVILTSSSILGLKIDSREVDDQLKQIGAVHSRISLDQLTKNGYVEVEATTDKGERIITGDKKAVKKEIDNMRDFVKACKSVITNRRRRGDTGETT